jgi:hypothetical protein
MPVIGNFQSCRLRVLLTLWLAVLGLILPGAAKADDTNGAGPVVSVQVAGNAAESGSPSGAFTIQRTGDTGQALVVNYCISGTATNGIDYQRLSGTVTIPAGQSSTAIEVAPIDNLAEEASKNVTLTLVTRNQPFTIIALPDTQYYTHEIFGATRDIFTAQTQWIVDHKDELNIAFVLHEGDITDDNNAPEWTNARTSMSLLNGVVPYALAVGNHDGLYTSRSDTALFNQYFPLSQFQNLPTFGGVFESNRMDNCYHLFSAGGVDWLLLSLEFGPRNEVLAWANQVVTDHPDCRVIMLTHAHVYCDNTLIGSSANQGAIPTSYGRMNNGTDVWEKFLRQHANTAFVFNGHTGGTGRLVETNDYGNRVFQMLADYQFDTLGGEGYLRIVQFYPDQDKMWVRTYSPYLDDWRTDSANQFVYANLGVFTNASPGYLVDAQYASASLMITNDDVDLTPPDVSKLSYMGVPPIIKVTFNEPVETSSAQTITNYSLDKGIPLTGATLSPDGRTVALTTDSDFTPNELYTLTVSHVKDGSQANNEMIAPVVNAFTYVPVLLSDDFTNGILNGWTVVDEGTINGPSQWLERSGRLMQLSNIYGPNANAYDHRKGTYLYWNDPPALGWSDYTFSVTFSALDDDGLGVMFRYQNPSNYFKVDLDCQKNFRKLFKMANGVETTLATEFAGYIPGSNYVLRVETTNSDITVLLNGTVLFGGAITDSNSLKAGTVALYSWGSQGVFFNNLKVTPLRRFPRVTVSSPTNGAVFVQPAPIPITVDASDPDGHITQVYLFQGTYRLVTLTNAPYVFQWTNMPSGSYTLTAQILDDAGLVGISPPVSFVVSRPPPKPTFIEQPASQSVRLGNGVVLRARTVGPNPIGYQWLFNGAPVVGATNTLLIINDVQSQNFGSYTVMATNQWGATVSAAANLNLDLTVPPAGDTNGPPSVYLSSVEIQDSGVPLISVNVTNVTVVRIDWSSNFVGWTQLLTLTNGGNTLYFDDPDAASRPCRFYRAVAQ